MYLSSNGEPWIPISKTLEGDHEQYTREISPPPPMLAVRNGITSGKFRTTSPPSFLEAGLYNFRLVHRLLSAHRGWVRDKIYQVVSP